MWAILLGAPIVLSRLAMRDWLGATAPFLMAWPGIIVAAFLGGFWPAAAITLLAWIVAQVALRQAGVPPLGPGQAMIFLAFGLLFAAAGGARKRGLRRAKATADRLAEVQIRMQQVARLNAVGEMAGALAHELNQPLTAIANYLSAARELSGRDGPDGASIAELLDKAARQAQRAGQIVARVRANVDRGEVATAPQTLSALIQEALEVATAGGQKAGFTIRCDFDRGADCVLADRLQVQQVVLNLIRNAIEAMAAAPRRELKISTHALEPGFVEISICDTGPGVAPAVVKRLFEPFVGDKPTGMGIGLSISRGIVEAHGGRMWLNGDDAGGADFRFSLPRADVDALAPGPAQP